MGEPKPATNDFLLTLLGLQQDGSHAISRPKEWGTPPPLHVETDLTRGVPELAAALLAPHDSGGRWHFLLGSPGNGKSTVVGELFRHLRNDLGCKTEESPSADDVVSYRVEVTTPADKKYSRLWLVQDASTVRSPFAPDANAAADLARELKAAEAAGVSLVVCANRGVLERVHDEHQSSDSWFQAVKALIKEKPQQSLRLKGAGKNAPYDRVSVHFAPLDRQSLLAGENPVLSEVLDQALADSRWQPCTQCPSATVCPFYANAASLRLPKWRLGLMRVLRHAEAWSGQPIVFREAMALLSYLLSGAGSDYANHSHPCHWVHDQRRNENHFGLLSRRVYAQLFASPEPCGLDEDSDTRREQVGLVREIVEGAGAAGEKLGPLRAVAEAGGHPTTDVGAARLLARTGAIRQFDPARAALSRSTRRAWSAEHLLTSFSEIEGASELERIALESWGSAMEATEAHPERLGAPHVGVLQRWSSGFCLRLGGLLEGWHNWAEPLDRFREIVESVRNESLSDDGRRRLRDLGKQLSWVLQRVDDTSEGFIRISSCFEVGGAAVTDLSTVKVKAQTSESGLSLLMGFGNAPPEAGMFLSGELYSWLAAVEERGLLARSVPQRFVAYLLQARGRAVAMSNYARPNSGELLLRTERPDSSQVTAQWEDGHLFVQREEP